MKKGSLFPLFMVLLVIASLPLLYSRLVTKAELTQNALGDTPRTILQATYEKEYVTNYARTAAQLALPSIQHGVAERNGYLDESCGALDDGPDHCTVVNTGKQFCAPRFHDLVLDEFNTHLDSYLNEYNAVAVAPFPLSNYDLYLESGKLHAIATLPIEKPLTGHGKQVVGIGTMWFAPSFTLETKHGFEQYKTIFERLKLLLELCSNKTNFVSCVNENKQLTENWHLTEHPPYLVVRVFEPAQLCYAFDIQSSAPSVPTT